MDDMTTRTWLCPCGGKTAYRTKRLAQEAASGILLRTKQGQRGVRRRSRPKYLRVYHCAKCNGWHLTKQPLREKP